MALSKSITKNLYGKEVIYDNCYIKIISISGNKDLLFLSIGIYTNDKAYQIDTDTYSFIPNVSDTAKNFLKQGYEALKASKYSDAIDLLDEGQTA